MSLIKNYHIIKKARVTHGFFTRLNGFSKNDFRSLNCSISSGDNKKLEKLESYCQAIEDFINDIKTITAGSSSSDKFLSYKILSSLRSRCTLLCLCM